MASTEAIETENKSLVRRWTEEVWSRGDLDLVDEYLADDYVEYNSASPEPIRGREAYRENVRTFRSAFPDLSLTTEDVFAEDERVATRVTATGTHRGELMGIEPTGAEVTISGIVIQRIEDGKFTEAWVNMDLLGLFTQIGVVEPPAA